MLNLASEVQLLVVGHSRIELQLLQLSLLLCCLRQMCPQHMPEKVHDVAPMVQVLVYPFDGEVLFLVELLKISMESLQFDLHLIHSGSILIYDNPAGFRVSTRLLVVGDSRLKKVLDLRESELGSCRILWWLNGCTLLGARSQSCTFQLAG